MSGKKQQFFEDGNKKVMFDESSIAIYEENDIVRILCGCGIETLCMALDCALQVMDEEEYADLMDAEEN